MTRTAPATFRALATSKLGGPGTSPPPASDSWTACCRTSATASGASARARRSALIVILTLALGIGANTAIFSVVNAVLLRPLDYAEPARLVTIEHFYPSLNGLKAPVSVPGFRDYQARGRSFASMAVETGWAANLTGVGEPDRLQGARVTGRFFGTLGVPALQGRVLQPGEDSAGREHVVVLSYGLWQRLFGGEARAVGRTLSLNGESYEVVGVMPREFRDVFNRTVELWAPLGLSARGRWATTGEPTNTSTSWPGSGRAFSTGAGRRGDAEPRRAAQAAIPGQLSGGLELS